jgi:hypothetical protein
MTIIQSFFGFDPISTAAYPSGYEIFYYIRISLGLTIGIGYAVRIKDVKTASRLKNFACIGLLLALFMFVTIRQNLLVEYVDQGVELNGENSAKNLVVPLPFPGIRSKIFIQTYAPETEPYFKRLKGMQMRNIVFDSDNLFATNVTIIVHWFCYSAFLTLLCLVFVLGFRITVHYFTKKF